MGKLLELIRPNHTVEIPAAFYLRHAQKTGTNGDISVEGRISSLSHGLTLTDRLRKQDIPAVIIEDANVDRVRHTADNYQLAFTQAGIPLNREAKQELSRDAIFLNPDRSELRNRIYATLGKKDADSDEKMGQLLLDWMDHGEEGYGMADGTVSFNQAQRVQAYWLQNAFRTMRENYQQDRSSPVLLRFTHEIQAFVVATLAEKRDRRGRVVKTGKDIVRERKGMTKNLTGPAFYYQPHRDTFIMKLPRYNRHGQVHDYEVFSVNEDSINQLAQQVYAVPDVVLESRYDSSPSLLVRTMRRQVAMGHPVISSVEQSSLAA